MPTAKCSLPTANSGTPSTDAWAVGFGPVGPIRAWGVRPCVRKCASRHWVTLIVENPRYAQNASMSAMAFC